MIKPTSKTAKTTKAFGFALGLALIGAACGSDAKVATPATTASPATTKAPAATTAAPTASGAAKNFGAGCAAVPTSGAGSFDGMATAPAATAASANPVLSTLVAAVGAAGLVDTLNSAGPFTIFAPSNDAFAKIPKATLDKLLADPKGDLTKILTLHVVAGQKLDADGLVKAGSVKTVNGGDVKITKVGNDYMVNGAKVICGNVQTANATVMIIDTVLLPG